MKEGIKTGDIIDLDIKLLSKENFWNNHVLDKEQNFICKSTESILKNRYKGLTVIGVVEADNMLLIRIPGTTDGFITMDKKFVKFSS